jgi:hypothetical protein
MRLRPELYSYIEETVEASRCFPVLREATERIEYMVQDLQIQVGERFVDHNRLVNNKVRLITRACLQGNMRGLI